MANPLFSSNRHGTSKSCLKIVAFLIPLVASGCMQGLKPGPHPQAVTGRSPAASMVVRANSETELLDNVKSLFNHAEHRQQKTPGANLPGSFSATDVSEIRITGNTSIPAYEIRPHIQSQLGRPVDSDEIKEDLERLYATRWFFDARHEIQKNSQGTVLVFHVVERPIVQKVIYHGNKKVKKKDLEALTGLKKGSAMDPALNRQARRRIQEYYVEQGYNFATVNLIEGNTTDDRRVVFDISEGEKVVVQSIHFEGNQFFSTSLLQTKLLTKKQWFLFWGGQYDPQTIKDDVQRLEAYYTSLGFFDIKVTAEKRSDTTDLSKIKVTFFVDEGMRYQVRSIGFSGNQNVSTEELRANLSLDEDSPFAQYKLDLDVARFREMYGAIGHYYARITPEPQFDKEEGYLNLIYEIMEGEPFRVRNIHVHIDGENPRTQETVVRNLLRIRPGDLLDPSKLRRSEKRLQSSQLFMVNPLTGAIPHIKVADPGIDNLTPRPPVVVRAQHQDAESAGEDDLFPVDPFSPDTESPPPGWRDLDVFAEEAQTGRFLFGVGVDSNSGILGNIVLHERNFDLFRTPESVDDALDGTAFRGAGQDLRIEALPGSRVSRYMLSFREPYLFDLPISFGGSAHYYQRFFEDWDEQRVGGRFSFGHAFTDEIAMNTSLKLENIEIRNPEVPTPPDLLDAVGDHFLGVVRFALSHDTRDSPFLATEGHFVELAYEQGFGDFSFPRGTLEGRQYFTIRQRPDGTGRHVLSLRGLAGLTGEDTPIFDRFFAGGFRTLRGFDFRGASPRVMRVHVGGEFELLGSVEYQIPLTADDVLQGVTFVDFGTIEEELQIEADDFRVSLGAGLRIAMPAFGPAPIALDFAVPIAREDGDDIELFSFWIGFLR